MDTVSLTSIFSVKHLCIGQLPFTCETHTGSLSYLVRGWYTGHYKVDISLGKFGVLPPVMHSNQHFMFFSNFPYEHICSLSNFNHWPNMFHTFTLAATFKGLSFHKETG